MGALMGALIGGLHRAGFMRRFSGKLLSVSLQGTTRYTGRADTSQYQPVLLSGEGAH